MARSHPTAVSIRRRGLLSVKDTIESVVVAFILAFVFRAFVAEAFVIPTGSMAPNLYGIHRMHTCPACGTEYAYGLSPVAGGRLQPPSHLICPNCRHAGDEPSRGPQDNGDRIFVLKWLFDVGRILPDVEANDGPRRWWHVFKPCRWDVVVFKDPNDGTTNFIKRLIGLPGEVLEIIDGDIYTAPTAELTGTEAGRSLLEKLEHDRAAYEQLTSEEQRTLNLALRIRRKTARSERSLWLTTYDHDFTPVKKPHLAGWRPVGKSSGWQTDERELRFTGSPDETIQQIAFARPVPEWTDHNAHAFGYHPVTDVYAYNGSRGGYSADGNGADGIDVGDLRLRCVLVPRGGQGVVTLSLSKRADRFVAAFASDGTVTLTRSATRSAESAPASIGRCRVAPLEPDRPVRLALSNVDYRVTVWVDDEPVLRTTDDQYPAFGDTGPECLAEHARQFQYDGTQPVPEVRLGAAGMPVELWHVAIDRDVYYRSPRNRGRTVGWGVQGQPIYLRDRPEDGIREYYCLGDNSPLSKDSRLWNTIGMHLTHMLATGAYQYGTVPADQMIGRAFFVYWPAGYPLIQGRLPLVPNVGDMRLIR